MYQCVMTTGQLCMSDSANDCLNDDDVCTPWLMFLSIALDSVRDDWMHASILTVCVTAVVSMSDRE